MTETSEKPKFTIWLGDDWPGPYLVTYEDDRRNVLNVIVVNGVRTVAEACLVAEAECPPPNDKVSVSIRPARVAEASHHMEALAEHRKEYPPQIDAD